MKKLVWSAVVIFTMQIGSAQVLLSENSTNLSLGVLSGGWEFNGDADFKVVNSQISGLGKAIQITGPSTADIRGIAIESARRRINWGSRTVGNNIVEVKFAVKVISTNPNSFNRLNLQINTVEGGTGVNFIFNRVGDLIPLYYLYNTNTSTVQFEAVNPNTKTPQGEVGYYIINYDFYQGIVRIRRTNADGSINYADNTYRSGPVARSVVAATPTSIFISIPPGGGSIPLTPLKIGPKNSASTVFLIDNISVSAVSSLASTTPNANRVVANDEVKTKNLDNSITVSPNPLQDFVRIESNEDDIKINAVTISDMITGQILKQVKYDHINNTSLDTSYMKKGLYILNIDTNSGTLIKKVIKN
jgi:Secretion system C-terminal sorting domain